MVDDGQLTACQTPQYRKGKRKAVMVSNDEAEDERDNYISFLP